MHQHQKTELTGFMRQLHHQQKAKHNPFKFGNYDSCSSGKGLAAFTSFTFSIISSINTTVNSIQQELQPISQLHIKQSIKKSRN